jgi:hypothetical protein
MYVRGKIVRGSVAVLYLLIGLEIVIMISPFAAYFYAGYGPLLNALYAFPATAWLTGFFLPHAVVSKSGVWIRHPQYLFLAVAGLGLLLFWPRFFILILYVSMLFVYYLLARHEEQRMLAQHGEGYQEYMRRTSMFLPAEPGGRIFRTLFGWSQSKAAALGLAYALSLALSVAVAFGLRSYTISKSSIVYVPEKQLTAVSIIPQPDESILNIMNIAFQDSSIAAAMADYRKKGHAGFMVHIMPRQYMMQGLFAQPEMSAMHTRARRSFSSILRFVFPFLGRRGHREMMGSADGGPVRLIVSQLTWPNGQYAPGEEALAFTVKHLPLLRVDIDTTSQKVLNVEHTAPRNYWGQMPMPVF